MWSSGRFPFNLTLQYDKSMILRTQFTENTRDHLALLGAWLCALVIVLYPIFDYDLYWHLANGREMVQNGRIISEDVFSFTHFGEKFENHEWLSQIIWYLIWHNLGLYGLLGFKLLVTSLVVLLLYRTIRIAGGQPGLAAVLCVFAVLAGLYRYIERPELFSLLNTTLVSFILFGFRAGHLSRRLLWLVPLILVVWDWLHGSVYGLALFALFVAGENAKHFFPVLRHGQTLAREHLAYLNRCFAVAILAMLANPFGLRSYGIFIEFMSKKDVVDTASRIMEFMPINWAEFKPYILLFAWAVLLSLRHIRRLDITQLLVLLVFGCGALRYSRVTGVAAIVLAPVIASLTMTGVRNAKGKLETNLHAVTVVLAAAFIAGYGYIAKFRDVSPQSFGYHVDEGYLPVGSVRFVKAAGLTGNLYNTGHFGGYLSFYLAPERKIFQYNLPKVFGDTYRFASHPEELAQWNINYAIVANPDELATLFPARDWARIYRDPGGILVVRRTPQNQELISQYEIRHFHPMMPDDGLRARAGNPDVVPRLAFEMGAYLAYRKDKRIAGLWEEILAAQPNLRNQPDIQRLLQQAQEYNNFGKLAQLAGQT